MFLTSISVEVSYKIGCRRRRKTNCATVMSFPWSVHFYQALFSNKQHARNRSVMVKMYFDLGYGQVHCTMAKYDWQERKAMLRWTSNLSLHIKVRASFLPSLLGKLCIKLSNIFKSTLDIVGNFSSFKCFLKVRKKYRVRRNTQSTSSMQYF